jgi:hypothetical protein
MAIRTSDAELLAELKRIGAEYNYAPEAVLNLARAAVKFQRDALVPNFPPFPVEIDECEIADEVTQNWPDWISELLPKGSKWEQLHWPDGSRTIRLIDAHGGVLAATRIYRNTTS